MSISIDKVKESANPDAYFVPLDGIRFFAVSFVMFGHWIFYTQLQEFNVFIATTGVNIFFTISGFLIARILLLQKVKFHQKGLPLFSSFYMRRILRIFPLYYGILLAGLVLAIPGAKETGIRLATFTLNIPSETLGFWPSGYFTHFWSLAAEEQFYLVFPFLIILTPSKFLCQLFWGMMIIGILSRVSIYISDYSLYHKKWAANNITFCCLDSFGIGALLSWYYCIKPERLKAVISNYLFQVVCISLFLLTGTAKILFTDLPISNLFFRTGTSIFCFLLFGSLLLKTAPKWLYDILTFKTISYLGKISFGIYVFHAFIPWVLEKLNLYKINYPFSIPLNAALCATITIILAAISWEFFEKPINRLKFKFPYRK